MRVMSEWTDDIAKFNHQTVLDGLIGYVTPGEITDIILDMKHF